MPQPPADPTSAPVLTYAKSPRAGLLRRWLRPGSPGFVILILLLASAGTWGGWKWRLRADEKAFNRCARIIYVSGKVIGFTAPPTRAAMRHRARLSGSWTSGLKTLTVLKLGGTSVTDAGLNELSRPDSGLKALTSLDLSGRRKSRRRLRAGRTSGGSTRWIQPTKTNRLRAVFCMW
jgi:hypothetical protein